MLSAMLDFETFRDTSYETNNKPLEIREREEQSLEILPPLEIPIPLPHEIAKGARRPLPHELLGLHVLAKQGSYKRVREYHQGWHPEEGTLIEGLTGPETIVEKNSIEPLGIFEVEECQDLYKAVSHQEDSLYTLGMGGAKVISLPKNEWIEGGEHGISACTTENEAKRIIKDANRRTKLPIPENMEVIPIKGEVREGRRQRIICDRIFIEKEREKPLIHKYHGDYGLPEEECLNGVHCPFPEIIINGKGTRREVRPVKFIPETPEEQVIVFPDKKRFEVNWRRNLEKITEITRLVEAADIVQEEGVYRVPLSNPEIPYAMGLIFSDAHIGNYTTDHELIVNLIDTVLATPNSFLMDAGDTFDNGLWMGLQYEQIMPPYMQQFTVEDMIRELGNKYAACVIGNHPEWMFNVAGIKPEAMFARKMQGPVFPGMGLLHLEVGQQKYDIALAHNFWGKSKKNIHNVCVNLRNQEYPDADVFVVGHEHIWGHMKEMNDKRERLYIRPGTAKLRDRYARIHGIAKRGQACGIAVIFGADKKEFNAYTLEDAVELMQLREKLAQIMKSA